MSSENIFSDFLGKLGDIQAMSSASESKDLFMKCEQFSEYFGMWIEKMKEFNIAQVPMFELSLSEYELSLIMAASGLYKQAMESLRFSLEHSLFAVVLSTDELKYRLWKAHEKDEIWAETTNAENGIFGSKFIKAFAPELFEYKNELQNITRNVYRESSEYVHGNFEIMQHVPMKISYSEDLYNDFVDKADSVAYIITFAFVIRFWDQLKDTTLADLESAIMAYLDTSPEILALYGI